MRTTKQVLLLLLSTALLAESKYSLFSDSPLRVQKKVTPKNDIAMISTLNVTTNMTLNMTNATNLQGFYWPLSMHSSGLPMGTVKVGKSNLLATVDVDSPTLIVSLNPAQGYDATTSTTDGQSDPFRYMDGSKGLFGYYLTEQAGFVHGNMTHMSPTPVSFFGAQINTGSIPQPFSAVIGLGLGAPMYGSSFLTQLATVMPTATKQWSFYSSALPGQATQLFVGGIKNDLVQSKVGNLSLPMAWYPTNGVNWTISMSDLKFAGVSIFNTSETSKAYFNFNSDSILLPPTTYNKTVTALLKAIPGLVCSNTSNCVYNDVCSSISSKVPVMSFNFDGSTTFSIPVQTEVMDNQNQATCVFGIGRQTRGNFVTLGMPFMKAFYTAYNIDTAKVGVALSVGSFGSITKN